MLTDKLMEIEKTFETADEQESGKVKETRRIFLDILLDQFFRDEDFFRAYAENDPKQLQSRDIILSTHINSYKKDRRGYESIKVESCYFETDDYQALLFTELVQRQEVKYKGDPKIDFLFSYYEHFLIVRYKETNKVRVFRCLLPVNGYFTGGRILPLKKKRFCDTKDDFDYQRHVYVNDAGKELPEFQTSYEPIIFKLERDEICERKGKSNVFDTFSRFYDILSAVTEQVTERRKTNGHHGNKDYHYKQAKDVELKTGRMLEALKSEQ